MQTIPIQGLFCLDFLSAVMITLICFVTSIVYCFSLRYMQGDSTYFVFLSKLIKVCFFASLMVISDNLILFFMAWILSNIVLVQLMIHKSTWKSAFCSGMLAGKNFSLGAIFLGLAFTLLYCATGELSIKTIASQNISPSFLLASQIFLLLAAMTQSAIWPFHTWLISSLNSPTPVSAIMHAGLINGGGFLLVRFSFLYSNSPNILMLMFVVGLITACIGTVWKLMQHDIKRMLACSTMGQMGFMFVQCGLGLFAMAIVHLCLHGLFKAYLFLSSGGAAQAKQIDLKYPPKWSSFLLAAAGGFVGCYSFAYMSSKTWKNCDANLITFFLIWILCSQFMLSLLIKRSFMRIVSLFLSVLFLSSMYGAMIHFLDYLLEDLIPVHPQHLNVIHFFGLGVLFFGWVAIFFVGQLNRLSAAPRWILYLYVKILNASQPDFTTITTNRNAYSYLK